MARLKISNTAKKIADILGENGRAQKSQIQRALKADANQESPVE